MLGIRLWDIIQKRSKFVFRRVLLLWLSSSGQRWRDASSLTGREEAVHRKGRSLGRGSLRRASLSHQGV